MARHTARAARVWGMLWRVTVMVAIGLVIFTETWAPITDAADAAGSSWDPFGGRIALDALLGVVAIVLYTLRQRWPMLLLTIVVAISAVSSFASVAVIFGVVAIATRRRRGEIIIVSFVFVAAQLLNGAIFPPAPDDLPWLETLLVAVALNAVLVLIGLYLGGRQQLVLVLHERAEQIQREHDTRLEAAAMAERTRIARDMHDSLAHRLSLVSLHAGVLEYRTDLSPEQTRMAAGIVRENARLAASDLREVLGILRDPSEAATKDVVRAPESVWEALDLLMQESRAADSPVELSIDKKTAGQLNHLPPASRGHLQRIVQEGLTNARKHAPWQPIDLRLAGSRGRRLSVILTNPIAADTVPGDAREQIPKLDPVASGFGLVGLNERVKIAAGELTITRTDGVFALQAWIPWPR